MPAKNKSDLICSSCHQTVSGFRCTNCKSCRDCGCYCRMCELCHKKVARRAPTYCDRCRTCRGCCACRKMPHFTPPHRLRVRRGGSLLNTLPRLIGVELEIADWKNLHEAEFRHLSYNRAHDASVVPSGMEMVIDPLGGDAVLNGMMELAEKLHTYGAIFNDTCAFHVHVEGADLSYWEIRRLLRVYSRIEAEIYDYLILPHRRDVPHVTHYCQMMTRRHEYCPKCQRYDNQYPQQRRDLPMLPSILRALNLAKSTTDLKAMVLEMLYNINPSPMQSLNSERMLPGRYAEFQTRKGGRYEWCRYVGLNLHAWQYRGTIEWRMKEATGSLDELMAWPLWCGWFVHAVTQMSEKDSFDDKLTLLSFTERYMPKWITAWVQKKVSVGPTAKLTNIPAPAVDTPARRPRATGVNTMARNEAIARIINEVPEPPPLYVRTDWNFITLENPVPTNEPTMTNEEDNF